MSFVTVAIVAFLFFILLFFVMLIIIGSKGIATTEEASSKEKDTKKKPKFSTARKIIEKIFLPKEKWLWMIILLLSVILITYVLSEINDSYRYTEDFEVQKVSGDGSYSAVGETISFYGGTTGSVFRVSTDWEDAMWLRFNAYGGDGANFTLYAGNFAFSEVELSEKNIYSDPYVPYSAAISSGGSVFAEVNQDRQRKILDSYLISFDNKKRYEIVLVVVVPKEKKVVLSEMVLKYKY